MPADAAHPQRIRRSRGRDPLGLRRVLADRLLPALVAAMALLAALTLAGARGAAGLAAHWQQGAAAAVTVQVPQPSPDRIASTLAALRALPEVAEARPVDAERMADLLRPWLGDASSLPLPAIIELRLRQLPDDPATVAARLAAAVPDAVVEAHGIWVARLAALARSVQAIALGVLLLVLAVAVAVVAVAIRAGIAARRDAIAILHDLGATDADIAGRFARRIAFLCAAGAVLGTLLAIPALAALAAMAAPLLGGVTGTLAWASLPWAELLLLPVVIAGLAWLTAQVSVLRWLRRLP